MELMITALLLVPGTVGAALLLRGALLEGRFLLEPARRLGRTGGLWMMWGGALLFLLIPFHPGIEDRLILGLLGSAAGIGLLSGLSRKPRPGGFAAATLWGLGLILVIYDRLTAG